MMTTLYKILSYLTPISIEKNSSSHNAVIEIAWQNGIKVLNSNNANFSYGSCHQVFQYGFKHYNLPLNEIKSVLILGFGGGSVYSILRNEHNFKGHITGVELDDKIIKASKKHFNIPENNANFKLINANAATFIAATTEVYDLIVVDIFNDLEVPQEFIAVPFLQLANKKLTNDGAILYNIINQKDQLLQTAKECYMTYETSSVEVYDTVNYIIKINKKQ